jgi:hypothetical protein
MYAAMHRTQLNLDDWQYESLQTLSEREGRSMSDLVREAVANYLLDSQPAPGGKLSDLRGLVDDPEVSGRDHDRVLYGEG